MNRRFFLQTMAASGLMAGFPVFPPGSDAPAWHRYSQPDLLDILDDDDAVRAIGHAYRRRFPAHDDAQTLGGMLAEERAERLSTRVQADFAHGRTIQLNGWILSVTEARQCALYSLMVS